MSVWCPENSEEMGRKKTGKEDDDGEGEKLTRIAIVSAEKCKPKKVSGREQPSPAFVALHRCGLVWGVVALFVLNL